MQRLEQNVTGAADWSGLPVLVAGSAGAGSDELPLRRLRSSAARERELERAEALGQASARSPLTPCTPSSSFSRQVAAGSHWAGWQLPSCPRATKNRGC